MCFAPQRRALIRYLNFQKWSEHEVFCAFWLGNVLRATTACNFSSLIWPAGSAPAALASLLFNLPEPQIIGKTQCFATFLPFRAPGLLSSETFSFWASFFFSSLLFSSLLWLFSSLTLPIAAFHLSILSEVWLLNFLRWIGMQPLTVMQTWVGHWWKVGERVLLASGGKLEAQDSAKLQSVSRFQGNRHFRHVLTHQWPMDI